MNIIFRHVVTGIIYSIFLTLAILGITFIVFPLENWKVILERNIFELPFIWVILILPILLGIISGISTGWYWRQRLQQINRQMNELVKGNQIISNQDIYSENISIQEKIEIGRAHV